MDTSQIGFEGEGKFKVSRGSEGVSLFKMGFGYLLVHEGTLRPSQVQLKGLLIVKDGLLRRGPSGQHTTVYPLYPVLNLVKEILPLGLLLELVIGLFIKFQGRRMLLLPFILFGQQEGTVYVILKGKVVQEVEPRDGLSQPFIALQGRGAPFLPQRGHKIFFLSLVV